MNILTNVREVEKYNSNSNKEIIFKNILVSTTISIIYSEYLIKILEAGEAQWSFASCWIFLLMNV